MSDATTDILLKQLVEGQDNLNHKFEQLIVIEAGRVEREVSQSVKNQEFIDFIRLNREPLNRVRRLQGHIDKAVSGVWSKALLALAIFIGASLAGFNWLG